MRKNIKRLRPLDRARWYAAWALAVAITVFSCTLPTSGAHANGMYFLVSFQWVDERGDLHVSAQYDILANGDLISIAQTSDSIEHRQVKTLFVKDSGQKCASYTLEEETTTPQNPVALYYKRCATIVRLAPDSVQIEIDNLEGSANQPDSILERTWIKFFLHYEQHINYAPGFPMPEGSCQVQLMAASRGDVTTSGRMLPFVKIEQQTCQTKMNYSQ
jgi:hypothetical protein